MRTVEPIPEMQSLCEAERRKGNRLVLVPTMGFLHEGHLALVRDGRSRGDLLIVSIFVNPTQFAPHEDFGKYPRDLERDRRLLEKEGVDVIFVPSAEDMYPAGYASYVEVERLGARLCGAFRPGHFRGVGTVVAKLFNIVRPHVAVFGAKDYQQLRIIRRMTEDLNFPVEIVSHPTVREEDGVAMSSRNNYLSEVERRAAQSLSRSLRKAEEMVRRGVRERGEILAAVRTEIAREPLVRLEYAELCDSNTLDPLERVDNRALLALAAWVGQARLIDNAVLTL